MAEPATRLLDADLPSLGDAWRWRPALVWLHALSDAGIAVAYIWIPLVLLYIVWQRPDLPFRTPARMFAAFVMACGFAHLLQVASIWSPVHVAAGVAKAIAALLAVGAALVAVWNVSRGLELAAGSQLRRADEALRAEAAARGEADRRFDLLQDALRGVGQADDLQTAFQMVLSRICEATGWDLGEVWTLRAESDRVLVLADSWARTDQLGRLSTAGRDVAVERGQGVIGSAWRDGKPQWVDDLGRDATFRRTTVAAELALHSAFAIPVLARDEVVAVLFFASVATQTEDPLLVALVSSVALELGSLVRRRRAEAALQDSEATLSSLFEFAPDAIIAVAPDGRIVRANLQAEATFGYSRDELRGQPVEILVPTRFRAAHGAHRAEFAAAPRQRTMGAGLRLFGLRKDGTEFPIDITLTPVEVGPRRVVMAVARDLTERRQAQRRFRRLLESAPDAVLIVARNRQLVQVNGRAEQLFGYTREELVGRSIDTLVPVARREAHRKGFDAYFAQPRVLHLGASGPEIHALRKDGTEVPIEVDLSPLETEVGQLALAAIRDLTERKQMEKERNELLHELRRGRERLQTLSTRLLEAQEQERRTIARELHDEIGQALTAVRIDLQALQPIVPDDGRPVVESALSITRRVVSQVRDLSLDLRPSLLDDLGLTAAIRWYLERHEHRLGVSATLVGDLADVRLPPQIETACFRVAQEALTNVARHAGARSVCVELRRTDAEIELSVRDDGDGFDVESKRARAVGGQSMGLLGMEERVTLVGGRFALESRPGGGTLVRATFPVNGPQGA